MKHILCTYAHNSKWNMRNLHSTPKYGIVFASSVVFYSFNIFRTIRECQSDTESKIKIRFSKEWKHFEVQIQEWGECVCVCVCLQMPYDKFTWKVHLLLSNNNIRMVPQTHCPDWNLLLSTYQTLNIYLHYAMYSHRFCISHSVLTGTIASVNLNWICSMWTY